MQRTAALQERDKLRFASLQQEAFLNLWRTYDRLRALEDELFGKHDLTAQQYNALRLLKAEHPGAIPTLVVLFELGCGRFRQDFIKADRHALGQA